MALDGASWVLGEGHADAEDQRFLREMFEALRSSLDPDGPVAACAKEHFVDGQSQTTCFDLGDFPALAADHSSTPARLVQRWFGPREPDGAAGLVEAAGHARRIREDPVGLDDSAPDPAALLAAVRDGSLDSERLLDRLREVDADVLNLAAHNAHHFWLYRFFPLDAAQSTLPNAAASYAYLHLSAIWEASWSRALEAPERQKALGRAALLELYALHFLEDALAAGHIAANRLELNPAASHVTHNQHNIVGVAVRTTLELRQRAQKIDSTVWAGPDELTKDEVTVTYGDGALLALMGGAETGAAKDVQWRRRVLAMGAALVSASLEELAASAATPVCEAPTQGCVPVTTSSRPTSTDVRDAIQRGWMKALAWVPTPVEWPAALYTVDMTLVHRLSVGASVGLAAGVSGEFAGGVGAVGSYSLLLSLPAEKAISLSQPYVGFEVEIAPRADLGNTNGPETPLQAIVIGGWSWAYQAVELRAGPAVKTSSWDQLFTSDSHLALQTGVRWYRRLDTRNTSATGIFVGVNYSPGEHHLVSIAFGGSVELWTTPPTACSFVYDGLEGRSQVIGGSMDLRCARDEYPSYTTLE